MKKLIITLIVALISLSAYSQETPPAMDANFKQLTTSQFYLHLPDSAIWQYKGAAYGWARIGRFKDINTKVDKVTGKSLISDSEIVRLLGIETGATKNQADVFLLSRQNHTGTQPISTVVGLQTSLDNKLSFSGGQMTGDIGFDLAPDKGISWSKNNDFARINFESSGDFIGDANMIFTSGDNILGDGQTEGWIFRKDGRGDGSPVITKDVLKLNLSQFKYNDYDVYHSGNLLNLNQIPTRSYNDLQNKPDFTSYQLRSEKGVANGYASLDGNGKVPLAQINDALVGSVNYQGNYDASTNSPALPAATGNKGKYYVISVGGTQQGLTFVSGDWIISNGTIWQKVDNNNSVTSVSGKTGAVLLNKNDVGLSLIDNTSDVNKPVSTAQQTALNGKLDLTGGTLTGALLGPNSTLNSTGFYHNGVLSIGGIGAFAGTVSSAAVPVSGNDLTNKTYVDGTFALKTGTNATGIWPIGISGLAANSSLLNGYAPAMTSTNNSIAQRDQFARLTADRFRYDNTSTDDGPLNIIMGMSGADKGIYRFTLSTVKAALATTLQDATASNPLTPNTVFVTGNFNPSGFSPSGRATYIQQSPSGPGTLESYNFGNASPNNLSINPNGGNVAINKTTANSTLDVNGNVSSSLAPTLAEHLTRKDYVDNKVLTATANLDFPIVLAQSAYGITVNVPGAVVGDPVVVGGGLVVTTSSYITGYVTSPNTVTVALINYTSSPTLSRITQTFKIKVFKD